MSVIIQECKSDGHTLIWIKSEDSNSLIESIAVCVKRYITVKIKAIITPMDKYFYDPVTFEPIENGKNYPVYGVLLES